MRSCQILKINPQKRSYSLLNKEISVDVFNEIAYRDTLNRDITYAEIYDHQDDDNKEIIYRYVISRNKYIVNGENFKKDVATGYVITTYFTSSIIVFTTIIVFNLSVFGTGTLICCTWLILRKLYNMDIYQVCYNNTHTEEEYRILEDHAKQIILTHQQKNRE